MNVLVGVDESSFSTAAVEFVKGMPWPKGTRVRIVSAAPPLFAMSGVDAAMPDVIAELVAQQERHHAGLAERAAKSMAGAGVACESDMVPGDPRSALLEEARRWRADLVVVGSHGRSGIKRMVLGSVAAHVASHAPCSVLIVKQAQDAEKD